MIKTHSLLEMLKYRRPHLSKTEEDFIAVYLDPIAGMQQDGFGNRYVRIGDSRTLFSAHTDTVHKHEGKQSLELDPYTNIVYKNDKKSNCLGADDTTGIWLMINMIESGVHGLYIFHRGEERGGLGSQYILDHHPELLEDIDRAIAFDRMGYTDVITHQAMGRCCSDAFATALGECIGMRYKPDPTGSFTDTATYTGVIPECTNVSVGYFAQHSKSENQDITHAEKLLDALVRINFEALPTMRDPKAAVDEYDSSWATFTGSRSCDLLPYFKNRQEAKDFLKHNPDLVADVLFEEFGKLHDDSIEFDLEADEMVGW